MAKMTANEMKATAREFVTKGLENILSEMDAIQFGDASWAVRTEVEGQEIWVEIGVKSKAFKATKTYDAFNPKTAREAWLEDKRLKAEEAAEKAAAKAAKEKEKA